MEFLFHITGIYPKWYPEANRYPANRQIKGRICAQDFTKGVGEVILGFLEEWLDPTLVKQKFRNPMGIPIKWVLKNGNVFDILTYEQTTDVFEGWKGHIAWFDEPPPRDKYIATLRGLVDTRGKVWLTLTPLKEAWIYDDIFTKSDGNRIKVVTADIRDNPHITEAAITDFELSLTEEEKEARLHGKFMHLSGLIYKEFGDHNICEPPKIGKTWSRFCCLDIHDRLPAAVVWVAVDNHDNHYVYDELWLEDVDIEQLAYAIKAQEGDLTPRVRFIDPAMDKENALAGGFNPRKELMKYGIFTERANTDTTLGKSRLKSALQPKYSHVSKTMLPQLRISRNCPQVIYEFQHYQWDDFRRHPENRDAKEKPKKRDDHFMDCLRYIYNYGPRYVPEEVEDEETRYVGEYVKYPAKSPSVGYANLVEHD